MILAIRISGMVDIPKKTEDTLFRMRLRRKYSAVLLEDTPENRKLLLRVRNFVAYGNISEDMLMRLVELRAESLDKKKINAKDIISGMEKKKLEELGVKPFFRLHPPRGGIDSKKHAGVDKGVLGDNKDKINQLLARML